jgi:hypothetical protein
VDTVEGRQTETPSVIWNESQGEFYMYYHNAGAGINQTTALATSADGITWRRHGLAVDIPSPAEFPGDGHTGYFWPFRIHNLWVGYHLLGGGSAAHFGIAYSRDGKRWHIDPRPLVYGQDSLREPAYRLERNHSTVVEWLGRLWWLGMKTNHVSGTTPKDASIILAPVSADLRNLAGPPQTVVMPSTQAWESPNIRALSTFSEHSKIYLYYQCDDKVGVATAGV